LSETRKMAAILVADVVGYSRLAAADEDRTLARLRGLRSDLIDPAIAAHHGRIVKRTGDGSLIEFRSVVDAVRCAIEVQSGMVERNVGVPEDRRIEFRIGVHLGDVVEEADGDLMGDGVNIAARLEGIGKPGAICLSEQAYWQVRGGSISPSPISAISNSRTSPTRSESTRSTSGSPRLPERSSRRSWLLKNRLRRASRWSFCRSPISAVTRRVVVQTLEVEPIRGLEVALDHAASTAFQISGAVLYLTRSLSSLN
jgi:class 3 adenylate cyclase